MTTNQLFSLSSLIKPENFVSIKEIQKAPNKALDWFKIVTNNGKPKWFYFTTEDLEDLFEDLEAMNSEHYKQMIRESREDTTLIPAEEVWNKLWI